MAPIPGLPPTASQQVKPYTLKTAGYVVAQRGKDPMVIESLNEFREAWIYDYQALCGVGCMLNAIYYDHRFLP